MLGEGEQPTTITVGEGPSWANTDAMTTARNPKVARTLIFLDVIEQRI